MNSATTRDLSATLAPGQTLWDPPRPKRTMRLVNGLAGRVIAGRYRVGRLVNDGSLCSTYEAHDLETGEAVTIELISRANGVVAATSTAMLDVARRIVGARHPGLRTVRTINVEAGAPFVVAAPVTGELLSDRLARTGPMPIAEAIAVAVQIIDGLAAAHAAGLVHGNLKPSKIRIGTSPSGAPVATVMGLGITTLLATVPGVDTRGVGTPPYLAPEQLTGFDGADELSDVWGIGLLVFEMLTGERAFEGSSPEDIGRRIASAAPRSLRRLRPDAPMPLELLVLGALARSRTQRLSLRDLRRAFADLQASLTPSAVSRAPEPEPDVIYDCSDPCDDAEAPTDLYLTIETDLGSL